MDPILKQMADGKDFQTASAKNIICEIDEKEGCYVKISESIFGGWNFHVVDSPHCNKFPIHFYKPDSKVLDVLKTMSEHGILGSKFNEIILKVNTVIYKNFLEKEKKMKESPPIQVLSITSQLELF